MEKRTTSGRPPKFEEARRPVTVTLPETTLQQLTAIHPDRARAIVKATTAVTGSHSDKSATVEVVEATPGQSVIVVGPSKSLQSIDWLRLVEIAPGRYLLVVPTGTAIESLEVAVEDLLERLPSEETYERELLSALLKVMRFRRRQQDVTKAEILLIRAGKRS